MAEILKMWKGEIDCFRARTELLHGFAITSHDPNIPALLQSLTNKYHVGVAQGDFSTIRRLVMSGPTAFIGYAHEDLEAATRLYHDLKRAGIEPWLDKERLTGGQRWEAAIREAIGSSSFF